MNPYLQLISLFSSASARFYCTEAELSAALLSVIHFSDKFSVSEDNFPVYKSRMALETIPLLSSLPDKDIYVTTDYSSDELKPGSLAYYPIKGMITADSRWWFSSKQFVLDLLDSEANPSINAHFLHVKSGGGEAWYLDEVSKTLSGLNKPVYTLVEKIAASAGYYIGVHGKVIKALTQNDLVGSIGTMVDGLDIMPYFEKMGIVRIRETATRSDLKNKKYEDLKNGKPEQFIREELDPLQQQFESAIRSARPQLNDIPDDDPVFRGESFYASPPAIDKKLIDGLTSFDSALAEAAAMGKEWARNQNNRKSLMSYI
ncbi:MULTISPECIES: S49 family peptidase [unclassified Dysgonomonas]|uniref:S49 family peptidase n=1 Tax=unclassified Dysgonomonas TaxID=2630389 RepID=UPI0025C71A4E|nr:MULTISPECIES: S49 family peptidase [unclassified Dysgonomonas]HMM02020.1 S49 family peptidase [Dysgonomonas sp.]